ncbi:MAG: ABC transporter permease [Candidatus Hydrogenedentales bacterium]
MRPEPEHGWRHGLARSWTKTRRTVQLGFKSLWLHRLRSLLTMLGLVFGVASVIAMLAVGEGASFAAQEQIRQQGSQNVIVQSVKPPPSEKNSEQRTQVSEYGITHRDLQRIRATIPTVDIVVPGRIIRKRVWRLGNRVDCDVLGTVPWYPYMRNHAVDSGRFFTEEEMEHAEKVCVVSAEIVNELFPLEAAIGKTVRIEKDYFRVIGVMSPLSGGAKAAGGAVSRVYLPLGTADHHFGELLVREQAGSREVERVEFHEVTLKVESLEKVEETAAIVDDLLKRYHKKQDYEVIVPLTLLRQAEDTARTFNIVLGAIAAISLLVGGIGIMNIMLASVTERTREIGIRRALGAKRRDIILQFIVETVLLAGTGGLIGVALGIAIPWFIEWAYGMTTIVTVWSPAVAFLISGLVGVVFGLYPAMRAARMDPVEALRHE